MTLLESDTDTEGEVRHFKIVVVGDGAVGKTSLIYRFTQEYFAQSYKQTIGLDFFSRQVLVSDFGVVVLQVWDVGGQSIGGRMLDHYLHNADAVLLCYDVTQLETFYNLQDWLAAAIDANPGRRPQLFLLANKTDLSHLRQVRIAQHNSFASEHTMRSSFVSAKTGDNVERTFTLVAASLVGKKLPKELLEESVHVTAATIIDHPADPATVEQPERRTGFCASQ